MPSNMKPENTRKKQPMQPFPNHGHKISCCRFFPLFFLDECVDILCTIHLFSCRSALSIINKKPLWWLTTMIQKNRCWLFLHTKRQCSYNIEYRAHHQASTLHLDPTPSLSLTFGPASEHGCRCFTMFSTFLQCASYQNALFLPTHNMNHFQKHTVTHLQLEVVVPLIQIRKKHPQGKHHPINSWDPNLRVQQITSGRFAHLRWWWGEFCWRWKITRDLKVFIYSTKRKQ